MPATADSGFQPTCDSCLTRSSQWSGRARAFRARKATIAALVAVTLVHFGTISSVDAQTANTYVSGKGNDSGACSVNQPCRTLQRAVTITAAGGQINALDSADYGYVTINKAISIVSAKGSTGVLAPSNISGVTVNAGATDVVNLQGMAIDGAGSGANGVQFVSGAALNIRDSVIRSFGRGINFQPTGASSLSVSNSLISSNTIGVVFRSPSSKPNVLNNVQIVGNGIGLSVAGTSSATPAILAIQNSIVANNPAVGVLATTYANVSLTNSTFANNGVGLETQSTSALLQVSGSSFSGNTTSWVGTNGGQIISLNGNVGGGNTGSTQSQTTPPAAFSLSATVTPTTQGQDPILLTKDILKDFGARCDGISDAAPAFAAFNAWAKAQTLPIMLTIPPGSTCLFGTGVGQWWVKGIKQLIVVGYGATLTSVNGTNFFLGGIGLFNDNKHSARLATVASGSSTVTLNNPSQASLFKVGNYALITGYDLQSLWQRPYGFPSNAHFFEYVKVTAINPTSGAVTFAAPLKNGYAATWPNYNSGNQFEIDAAGPATLYALDPSWDTQVEYRGLTISQTGQTYSVGRSVTYRDVTFTGGNGGIPTQNLLWQAINTNFGGIIMEVDKFVATVVMDKVTINQIKFQSSSSDLLAMSNSTITGAIYGTPKKAVISNSQIADIELGAYAYGRSDEVVVTNSVLSAVNVQGIRQNIAADWTMNGGVITFANTDATGSGPAQRWTVPGTNIIWQGTYENEGMFRIIDVTQDATNTYVKTNLSGGFPGVPGLLAIKVHPSPKFTCTNCTGSDAALDLSQAPPGAPLYSYSKRAFSPTTMGILATQKIWGKLVSLKVNVISPYTGTGAATLNVGGQFHNFTIKSDNTVFDYVPVINLKVAGERVITPLGVTCNGVAGACNGDSHLSLPEAVWFSGSIIPYMNNGITGTAPRFTVEIVTDQGVLNP